MANFIGSVMMNRNSVFGIEFPPNVQRALDEKAAEDSCDSDHNVDISENPE
jgi:hypothetical protein